MAPNANITPTHPDNLGEVSSQIVETWSNILVNRWRRAVVTALTGLALAVSSQAMAQTQDTSGTLVVAQAVPQNPKYDKIIADAKAASMSPLDYIDKLRKDWSLTFAEGREARKYYAERETIARRQYEGQLDQAAIRAIAENNALALKFISVLDTNRKKWLAPVPKEIEHLKKIYNDNETSAEVRKLIQEKFWDLFDFRTLIAQA